MSTTSLKLPDDVKELATTAARQQGVSLHSFMVDAIRTSARNAELRAQFIADAAAARKETLESGKGYVADEVHQYLQARIRGKASPKPRAKSWQK